MKEKTTISAHHVGTLARKLIERASASSASHAATPEEETMLMLMGYERSLVGDYWVLFQGSSVATGTAST